MRSTHLSPLVLALLQFGTQITCQVMRNLSPFQLDVGRVLELSAHDHSINWKNSPFCRISWLMFLVFPLDFQTKDYVNMVVTQFGRILVWNDNVNNSKSRVIVQALVLDVHEEPRSVVVCKGTDIGGTRHSWTVPVYILNSQPTDVPPTDEDPIPPDGNPHPVNGLFFPGNHQEPHPIFEDVNDVLEVNQANLNEGWDPKA